MEKTVKKLQEEKVMIPEGVETTLKDSLLTIKGSKGEVSRDFFSPIINIVKKDNTIIMSSGITTKKSLKILKTFVAHINNMCKGVQESFTYQLKICSGHFPMTLKKESNTIIITNFLGEKIPRRSKILEGTEVNIKGDLIEVTSMNIENAGQTAANLEQATKIKNRDRRVFQDGCFIIKKPR